MNCNNIKFGSYDCSYSIQTPFITPSVGGDKKRKYVSVDKCLLPEILKLWEQGIITTGCCCGHGNIDKSYIDVIFDDIEKMKLLGYKTAYNPCRPDDKDSFYPKTILKYQKGE